MTQLQEAQSKQFSDTMRRVAQRENVPARFIRDQVSAGKLVIPANVHHLPPTGRLDPVAIGRAVTTKINACLGSSPSKPSGADELEKLDWAVKYGADTVMDLSFHGDLDACRAELIAQSSVPVGTVPLYELATNRPIEELTKRDILAAIEKQAAQGVDYFTIHAGILREHLPLARNRTMGIASRGGALLAKWMIHHGKQNPLFELFNEIGAIMIESDVTCSLGNGLRPGCLADANDEAQAAELGVVGELVERAREMGVQTMVEGPGHMPYDQIEQSIRTATEVCSQAPFYVLGPVVTDTFPGYDHIAAAVGATAAAYHGAAFLCYVTPREHLGLPRKEDIKQGCIAMKIAAHAADVARGLPGAREWDDQLSKARAALNWEKQFALAYDPEVARALHDDSPSTNTSGCAIFGHDWTSIKRSQEIQEIIVAQA